MAALTAGREKTVRRLGGLLGSVAGCAGVVVAFANLLSASIARSVDATSQRGLNLDGWLGMTLSISMLGSSIAILLGWARGPALLLLFLGLSATLSGLPYMLFSGLSATVGGTLVTLVQRGSDRQRNLGRQ